SAVEGDLTEEVEDIGLVAPLLVGKRELARLLRDRLGALPLACDQEPVSEMRAPKREVRLDTEFLAEGDSILEEGQALFDTAEQDQGEAEDGRGNGLPDREVLLTASVKASLERMHGLLEVTAARPHQARQRPGDRLAISLTARVGDSLG